jgi:hypothetical protein
MEFEMCFSNVFSLAPEINDFFRCLRLSGYGTSPLVAIVSTGTCLNKKERPPSVGRGFWFFFRQKERPPLSGKWFLLYISNSNNNTGQHCYFR